jgi:tRNA threonylcarbamoyladenosine biosynthesis protein TsaE
MIEFTCPTATDTRAAAGRLASLCRAGDVIVLVGRLGAGKTAFVGGLADGLGVDERVVSPSFVLMRRYDSGFVPLIHVDVYRVGSMLEFEDLEVLELGRDGVVVIEWGDAVGPELPPDRLRVEIDVHEDESRTIRLIPLGRWSERPLEQVKA